MTEFGEHWTRKIKTYFTRLDKDGDGVLTENDFKLICDNIIKVRRYSGEREAEIRNKYSELWTKYFQPLSNNGKATFDELISVLKKHGKDEIKSDIAAQFSLFFDCFDTNQDGFIQLHEFVTFFNIVGVSEVFSKKAFDVMDTDRDTMLSRDEFVTAAVDFFTLEEPSLPCDLFYGFLE